MLEMVCCGVDREHNAKCVETETFSKQTERDSNDPICIIRHGLQCRVIDCELLTGSHVELSLYNKLDRCLAHDAQRKYSENFSFPASLVRSYSRTTSSHCSLFHRKQFSCQLSDVFTFKMSDAPSKIKDIDLEIFKDEISECIKPKNDNDIITELCTHCKRLCVASKYYDVLCTAKLDEEERKALLVEFMETVYESVLDDTAHFIKEHEGDLQRVWNEWTERYGFAKCSVSKCAKTARHYGRGRRNGNGRKNGGNEEDGRYTFYQSLFDRFHNYLAHLYQIGLRVDTASLIKSEGDGKEDEELGGVTVDTAFAAERDQVRSQREECKLDMDRLDDEKNKFTIQSEEKKTEYTLTDALFDKLKEEALMEHQEMQRLKEYLERGQFDSDGMIADLEDVTDSNVAEQVQNKSIMDKMIAFIRSIQCMSSFCTFRAHT